MAGAGRSSQNRPMDPVTLTTDRLLLRPLGRQDTDAVFEACQDPDIQRWTTVPSPYLREHAIGFTEESVPKGWADGSSFGFGAFLPDGRLAAAVGLTMQGLGAAEIGFWAAPEHRGRGLVTEAVLAVCRWAFAEVGLDRVEWRAEVGNRASRAVAERAGFRMEGTMRSGINNKGVRRDCWFASLLPCDMGLPSSAPYLPARDASGAGSTP